jgi:hypothetical protein
MGTERICLAAEVRLAQEAPCYVALALRVRRGHVLQVCLCGLAAAGAIGCGGGERQDANEPDETYEVEVMEASFPERQRLAQESELVIAVRNDDNKTIPDLAVTVDGFYRRLDDPDLSDPNRPVFIIKGRPVQLGGHPEVKLVAPEGGPTSTLNTWTLGPLKPNATKTFRWRVTAVRPGPFEISYAVAAGQDGKAEAVSRAVDPPMRGKFAGTIIAAAPPSRIGPDGRTVIVPAP